MYPKVTVAILAYYAPFLEESIQSVLDQTYKNIKVIVYDDCSPENLGEIVSKFDDPRLRYVRNEKNLREAGNFNQALELCDTEYINVFHGDDRMVPWMIEHEVEIMEARDDVGIVASSVEDYTNAPLCAIQMPDERKAKYYSRMELIKENICTARNQVNGCSAMLRKSMIDRYSIRPRGRRYLDWHFWIEINTTPMTICLLDYQLVARRTHDRSLSNTIGMDWWREAQRAIDEFFVRCETGCDLRDIRANFARTCIKYAVKSAGKQYDLRELVSLRESLEEKNGWIISDYEFYETIAPGVSGDGGANTYIMSLWEKHFAGMADRKLVIYGIAKNTETILSGFAPVNVVGLMDGARADGTIYGKPIISMDEAVAWGVDAIVIVAQVNNIKFIVPRIVDACIAHSIDIYHISGEMIDGNDMVKK